MSFEMQSLNEKLFQAVCKGKTGSVEKLLKQGANINAKDKKDGMTPLLKACQRRNYTMQKILLSNNANPKIKDKLGLSCLHYISEAGDAESLKLLMAYHASIDAKDINESTPLHYAADRNKLSAVDTLVFCGANGFEKNKKGITPLKSSNNPQIQQILKESELVLTGIKNGEIHIESVELEPGKTYKLKETDLTIHTPSSFPLKSLSFICRRVRPEYCHPSLKPYQKELLISDTFEFLTSETQTKAKVIMEVPIYDYPDPFEDIYMKTDRNSTILPNMKQTKESVTRDQTSTGRLKWICRTEVDVTNVRSFNLVTFPTKEVFEVGRSQIDIYSRVDKFIKISIMENTFVSPKGKVALEVIPSPVYHPEDISSILSVGHFYDLTNDRSEQPQKTVNLRVPLPHDYENDDSDLYLLGADVDSEYFLDPDMDRKYDLDHWEIISVNPKISRGCVDIPVQHFSIFVASEAKRNKAKSTVLSETSDLCRRASQKRTFILFLVLVKPVGQDVFNVIIECTTRRKKDDRMNYWINSNYLDQKPSHTGEFESIPGTKYMLKLNGNVETVTGFPKTRLEFHPKKQDNHQQFQVKMSDPSALNAASIDIYEIKDDPNGKEEADGLVSVPFRLTGTPFVEDIEPQENERFHGFTRDSLLRQLCKDIDEEWIKVAVLLGLSFRTVENYRTNNKLSSNVKKFKVLQLWRDTSKHRVDYGVDDLVSALHRINREDLVEIIHKELEIWLEGHCESQDRFYKWAENKLTGPNPHSSDVEQPVPASDQFFVLLIDKFGNNGNISQVGLHMGLTKPETDKIFNDALVTDREHQLLGMFVAAREKKGDMFKTFVDLVNSLESLHLPEARQWTMDMADQWIKGTEKDKNPVAWRQEIVQYLYKTSSRDDLDDEEKSDVSSQKKGDVNEAPEITGQEKTTEEITEESNDFRQRKDEVGESRESLKSSEEKNKRNNEELNGSSVSLKHTSEKQDTSQLNKSIVSLQGSREKRKNSDEILNGSYSSFQLTSENQETENFKENDGKGSTESFGHKKDEVKSGDKNTNVEIDKHFQGSKESLQDSRKNVNHDGDMTVAKMEDEQGSQGSLDSSVKGRRDRQVERKVSDVKIDKEEIAAREVNQTEEKERLISSKSGSSTTLQSTEKGEPTGPTKEESNIKVPIISEPQEEFAEHLSREIVDEVLHSVILYQEKKKSQPSSSQSDIQELREHLETTLDPAVTSADPSVASSNDHLNVSTDQYHSIKDKPSTQVAKEEASLSESDTENSQKMDNTPFLDVLSKQLPSADSSDDDKAD